MLFIPVEKNINFYFYFLLTDGTVTHTCNICCIYCTLYMYTYIVLYRFFFSKYCMSICER